MLQTSVEGVSLDPALTGGAALVLAIVLTAAWTLAVYR
jgi:preprotein translocase subunit Sec61beta